MCMVLLICCCTHRLLLSRTPLATFLEFKSDVLDMDLDEERWLWVTVGADKIVKVSQSHTLCMYIHVLW